MPRIIKAGEKKSPVFRGTCKNCGAVVEEDKAKLNVMCDRDGMLADCICPQCHKSMWVYPLPIGER